MKGAAHGRLDTTATAGVDVVREVLLRVKAAILAGRVSDRDLLEIETEVRTEFGGEARYVSRRLPTDVIHGQIAGDLARGDTKRAIARRRGVSVRTVQRIAATGSGENGAL